ncbi:MAG TPA: hypothetical protein VIE35_15865 [Dongiaceae bacterium]
MRSRFETDRIAGLGRDPAGRERALGAIDQEPAGLDASLDRASVEAQCFGLPPRAVAIDHQIEIAHGPGDEAAAAMPIAAEVEGLEALQDRLLRRLLEGEAHALAFDQGDGPVIAGKE